MKDTDIWNYAKRMNLRLDSPETNYVNILLKWLHDKAVLMTVNEVIFFNEHCLGTELATKALYLFTYERKHGYNDFVEDELTEVQKQFKKIYKKLSL